MSRARRDMEHLAGKPSIPISFVRKVGSISRGALPQFGLYESRAQACVPKSGPWSSIHVNANFRAAGSRQVFGVVLSIPILGAVMAITLLRPFSRRLQWRDLPPRPCQTPTANALLRLPDLSPADIEDVPMALLLCQTPKTTQTWSETVQSCWAPWILSWVEYTTLIPTLLRELKWSPQIPITKLGWHRCLWEPRRRHKSRDVPLSRSCSSQGCHFQEPVYLRRLAGIPLVYLGGLTYLRELDLEGHSLKGEIPPSLGQLTNLERLNLVFNHLSGEIPSFLGSLTRLRVLILGVNQFTGEIPITLGNLTGLRSLQLGHNQLTGEIPASLGNLPRLESLTLQNNRLIGNTPDYIGQLTDLTILNLSNNQLTGEIPPSLSELTRLSHLNLNNNQLTGEIPSSIGDLSSLKSLDLSYNQLSGEIPTALGNLESLTSLYLAGNALTGCVPAGLPRGDREFPKYRDNQEILTMRPC